MIFSKRNPFMELTFSAYSILLFLVFLILKPYSGSCNQDVSISQVMPDSNCALVAGGKVALRFEIHAETFAHNDSSCQIWYSWGDHDFKESNINRLYLLRKHEFALRTITIPVPNEPHTEKLLTVVVDLHGDENHENDTFRQMIYIDEDLGEHSLDIESEWFENPMELFKPGDTLNMPFSIRPQWEGLPLKPGDTLTLLIGERRNFTIPSSPFVKDTFIYNGPELNGNESHVMNYTITLPKSYDAGNHNLFAELYVTKMTKGRLRFYESDYYDNWSTWSVTVKKVGVDEKIKPKRAFYYKNGILKLDNSFSAENNDAHMFHIVGLDGRVLLHQKSLPEMRIPKSFSFKNGVYVVTAFNLRTGERYSQKLQIIQ